MSTTYRLLFEANPFPMWVYDVETLRFLAVNSAALSQYGYSREEFLSMTIKDIHPEEDVPALEQHLAREKTPFGQSGIWRHRRKDGSIIHCEISSHSLTFETRKARLILAHDVSSRIQMEQELKRSNEELEERVRKRTVELELAVAELEAFSYSVSHDLRAPLRAIDGFSQALLEDYSNKVDDAGRNYLNRVRAASQRMGQLIDDLLELSRVSRSEMHEDVVDLSELAERIAQDLQKDQADRQVDFSIEQGIVVKGDKRLLEVALQNLLTNAWKFTGKKDRARVEFGAIRDDGETRYFVRDNGVGFDMAYIHKIFSPFQRLHAASEFPGTGVGLATAQRIILRHGGRLWAEGKPGEGASFYFTV